MVLAEVRTAFGLGLAVLAEPVLRSVLLQHKVKVRGIY
jgi:hypothetical protein